MYLQINFDHSLDLADTNILYSLYFETGWDEKTVYIIANKYQFNLKAK